MHFEKIRGALLFWFFFLTNQVVFNTHSHWIEGILFWRRTKIVFPGTCVCKVMQIPEDKIKKYSTCAFNHDLIADVEWWWSKWLYFGVVIICPVLAAAIGIFIQDSIKRFENCVSKYRYIKNHWILWHELKFLPPSSSVPPTTFVFVLLIYL